MVRYCNAACQKLHWSSHKPFCADLKVKYEELQRIQKLEKEQEEKAKLEKERLEMEKEKSQIEELETEKENETKNFEQLEINGDGNESWWFSWNPFDEISDDDFLGFVKHSKPCLVFIKPL